MIRPLLMTRIFSIVITITAHVGWINGFLTAIGRDVYPLPTGGEHYSSSLHTFFRPLTQAFHFVHVQVFFRS